MEGLHNNFDKTGECQIEARLVGEPYFEETYALKRVRVEEDYGLIFLVIFLIFLVIDFFAVRRL